MTEYCVVQPPFIEIPYIDFTIESFVGKQM